jgi:hypothetical protein
VGFTHQSGNVLVLAKRIPKGKMPDPSRSQVCFPLEKPSICMLVKRIPREEVRLKPLTASFDRYSTNPATLNITLFIPIQQLPLLQHSPHACQVSLEQLVRQGEPGANNGEGKRRACGDLVPSQHKHVMVYCAVLCGVMLTPHNTTNTTNTIIRV